LTAPYQPGDGLRKRGRPRDDALDDRILEAAVRLMGERGYARMSIEAVAREAGTTKPSVYLRFGNKAGVATAALEYLRERSGVPQSGDTRADLVLELGRFVRGVSRPFGMATLGTVLAEEHETPELLALFRERVVRPRRERLRAVLDRARERGELRPGADLEVAVNMLIGAYYAQYVAGDPFGRAWTGRTVDAVLAGLTAD
jgi:AcrR family transcriptional regulator